MTMGAEYGPRVSLVRAVPSPLPCLFESWPGCENKPDDTALGKEAGDNTKGGWRETLTQFRRQRQKEEHMAKVILVVEDEPKSLKLIRDLLQVSGYKTIEATDGEKGVELAKAKKPDLILMDIMMPKMDGYTACREIKMDKATKAIPVVMLTFLDQELNKELGRDMGADGYITKPVNHQELLDVINRFLPAS